MSMTNQIVSRGNNKLDEIRQLVDQCFKVSLYSCSILHEWKEKNKINEDNISMLRQELEKEKKECLDLQSEIERLKEKEKFITELKERNENLEKEIKILKQEKKELKYQITLLKEEVEKNKSTPKNNGSN
jgi:chromosome segregation ATPase